MPSMAGAAGRRSGPSARRPYAARAESRPAGGEAEARDPRGGRRRARRRGGLDAQWRLRSRQIRELLHQLLEAVYRVGLCVSRRRGTRPPHIVFCAAWTTLFSLLALVGLI